MADTLATNLIRLSLRDLRGASRQLRLFFACLILATATIACIGLLMEGIRTGIAADAKSVIGGDIEARQLYVPTSKAVEAFFNTSGILSKTQDMRTMATYGEERQLVTLKAIDSAYPLYGTLTLDPPQYIPSPACGGGLGWGCPSSSQDSEDEGHPPPAPPASGRGKERKAEGGIHYDALFAQKNGHYGIAADPAMLDLFGAKIGDYLEIGEQSFEIRATITREPDRSFSIFAMGMSVLTSPEAFAATGLVQYGSMINYRYRLRLPEGSDALRFKYDLLERFPEAQTLNIRSHQEAAPVFINLLDRLGLFFSLTAISSLITAGIGISNAAGAYIWSRQRTIAIMKSLGAKGSHIVLIYLLQLLLMSAIGIAGGLALGIAAEYGLADILGEAVPSGSKAGIYAKPLWLAAGFGVVATLTFSLWPLYKASRVNPALLFRGTVEAVTLPWRDIPRPHRWKLAFYFTALIALLIEMAMMFTNTVTIPIYYALGMAGAFAVFAMISQGVKHYATRAAHHGKKPLPLVMALTNLGRPGAATSSIILALGIGMSLLVALALVGANLREQINEGLPESAPAFFLLDVFSDQKDTLTAALAAVEGSGEIVATPMIRGKLTGVNERELREENAPPEARWVLRSERGFTWMAAPPDNTRIVEGEWWPEDYTGEPLVSFDRKLARALNIQIGDTMHFMAMGNRISARVASLREINWGSLQMNFTTVFSPGTLDHISATYLFTVQATPEAEKQIQKLLSNDYPNISVIRIRQTLAHVATVMEQVSLAVMVTAMLTVLSGILVMASAINASLNKRIYDTVILKVLGITRPMIMRIYTLEFIIMTLAVAIASLVIGIGAAYAIMQLLAYTIFKMQWGVMLLTLAGGVIFSTLLGLLSTRHALKIRPLSLLRNE